MEVWREESMKEGKGERAKKHKGYQIKDGKGEERK